MYLSSTTLNRPFPAVALCHLEIPHSRTARTFWRRHRGGRARRDTRKHPGTIDGRHHHRYTAYFVDPRSTCIPGCESCQHVDTDRIAFSETKTPDGAEIVTHSLLVHKSHRRR
jgi:hypothetical protein